MQAVSVAFSPKVEKADAWWYSTSLNRIAAMICVILSRISEGVN